MSKKNRYNTKKGGIYDENESKVKIDQHAYDTLGYYNVSFINTSDNFVEAKIQETRTPAILKVPEFWQMSVIRFDIHTSSIPINVPTMQVILGVTSPTVTASRISLRYLGLVYTTDVIYIETSSKPLYSFPTVYNYQQWLDYVNTALITIYTNNGIIPGVPPKYIYNPMTQLIDLYVDDNYLPSAGANKIEIFLNDVLINYFYNFEYFLNPLNTTVTDVKYKLEITNTNVVQIPALVGRVGLPLFLQSAAPYNYAATNMNRCSQTTISMASWSSLRSIILTSTLLPFKPELIPSNRNQANNFNSNSIFPILSDFLIPGNNNLTDFHNSVEYLPVSEYRMIDLHGNTPLNSIDLLFFWSDYLGNYYPIYLPRNAGLACKIMFRKKLENVKIFN